MKKLLSLLLFVLAIQVGHAQESQLREDIRELLELTGSSKLGIQVMSQMIGSFQNIYPDVPQEFWEEFMKEIKEDDLTNLMIPIYEKYYTNEEIKGLIAFYETPLGQKTVKVLPQLTQDSMTAGQQWGAELGERVVQKLQEKGYLDK